jgi:hypothetical protein
MPHRKSLYYILRLRQHFPVRVCRTGYATNASMTIFRAAALHPGEACGRMTLHVGAHSRGFPHGRARLDVGGLGNVAIASDRPELRARGFGIAMQSRTVSHNTVSMPVL